MEVDVPIPKSSVHEYYVQKIQEKMLEVNEKGQNLRRLQAQRNELNAKGMYAWSTECSNPISSPQIFFFFFSEDVARRASAFARAGILRGRSCQTNG